MNFSITHDLFDLDAEDVRKLPALPRCSLLPNSVLSSNDTQPFLYLDHNPKHGHFTCFALNDRDCWEKRVRSGLRC